MAREGCETVVFLAGTLAAARDGGYFAVSLAAGAGLVAAVATYGLLQVGGKVLSWRLFFRVTEVLLLLLAGALLLTAADNLVALGLLPRLSGRLWDASELLSDGGAFGGLFASLTGWRARPTSPKISVFFAYWGAMAWLLFRPGATSLKARRRRRWKEGSTRSWRGSACGCATISSPSAACNGAWSAVYLFLVAVPAFLPLPQHAAHIWTNLVLFGQFVFWGLWWPFVLLSMALVGRLWCGLLCPEGALSERVSEHGRGGAMPHWLQWKGWPFLAFVLTTIYGQMTSVYQYPGPALVVLGGSTLAAMVVGCLWGRNKRVWCRFLCPVTGVFNLLAKLAPLHFRVDRPAWEDWDKPHGAHPQTMNCAPLVAVRTMRGAGACHMCGRCTGFRGAVTLARRSPNHEIIHVAGDMPNKWQSALILFGMFGLASGAFLWGNSALYVTIRQFLANRLVEWAPSGRWSPSRRGLC